MGVVVLTLGLPLVSPPPLLVGCPMLYVFAGLIVSCVLFLIYDDISVSKLSSSKNR